MVTEREREKKERQKTGRQPDKWREWEIDGQKVTTYTEEEKGD